MKNFVLGNNSKKNFVAVTEDLNQCIICGTILDDLDEDDIVEIQYGKLCYGCFQEGWFKRCAICGEYEFESNVTYNDEKELYFCNSCQSKEGKVE